MTTEFMTPEAFKRLQQTRVMKRSKKRQPSKGEERMAMHLNVYGIEYEREKRFHPVRLWRFDFILHEKYGRVAIEVEGGVWSKGRHTRGSGFIADMEKYNEAARYGWQVYRFTPAQVVKGIAIDTIRKAIGEKNVGG